MRKTKGFSYDPKKDKDVITFIDNKPNRSKYIWDLVRKDMNDSSLEMKIKEYIEAYFSQNTDNKQ